MPRQSARKRSPTAELREPDDYPFAPRWEPPRTSALPEMRAATARVVAGQRAVAATATTILNGKGSLVPSASTPYEAAEQLHRDEHYRLCHADLFMVSPEMTQLAVSAGESLPEFHLEPDDLPAPYGFMAFSAPIGSYVNRESGAPERIPIVAATWGQFNPPFYDNGGVWFTYYSPTDFPGMERLAREQGQRIDGRFRSRLRQSMGPLTWDNECAVPYGISKRFRFSPGDSHYGAADMSSPWFQTICSTWLLMNQPGVTEIESVHRSHASGQADRLEGLSTGPVRIIHLRRLLEHHDAPGSEPASREYTCRWLVRGHWRSQWFPKRQVHRPVWIAPHIKGPDDKPFRATDVVTLWDR